MLSDIHNSVFLISVEFMNEHITKTNNTLLIDVSSDNNIEDKTQFLLSNNFAFTKFSVLGEKENKYICITVCNSIAAINYKLLFASNTNVITLFK